MMKNLKHNKFKNRKNQSGLAIIETLPILVIFIMLIGYGLGFFGVVHSSILNSIAARNYAFETFRNRTNLEYFRDRKSGSEDLYSNIGNRTHGINAEQTSGGTGVYATTRPLAIGREIERSPASQVDHNLQVFNIIGRNRQGGVEVSPVWIMVGYGICINANCGD